MAQKEGIRRLKIKRVREYLLNVLLPLPCGAKLPGIRTIRKQTGAGQSIVTHVLRQLAQEGLLRVDPDRGIFRIKPTEKSDEIRLLHWLISSLNDSGFVNNMFDTLSHLAEEAGRKITVENVGQRSREEIAEELINHGISRCLIFGAQSAEFASYLCTHQKICLELLPRHIGAVTVELRDSPDMTARQMDYLLKRGYRKIGYLHFCGSDMDQYPVQVHRLMDYYRLMAENGLRVNPDWVFYCSDHYENLESGMERMMASDPKPEVLIVPGAALKYLYSYCRKNKIRIGKELAVFSQDEINADLSPEPTTITNNPLEIAWTFWQMFQAAERGEVVESAYTKLFIRTGQTVPSLKANFQ
ncbi:MAG: substrate-binding domain-containing protein [Lentisphaeria bacterium]|nr:substrate-binding domain-containing protein [Lentisphaeria bacterium]